MTGPDALPLRSRRSLLFVPGAEPHKLEGARKAGADTLLLDLEDSVAPAQKADARRYVVHALRAGGFGTAEPAVRVNAPGTPYFEEDLEAMVAAGGCSLMLPKAESPEDVTSVVETLEMLERRRGAEEIVKLLLLVESAAGVANAVAVGRAAARIEALCFGHADFSLQMGLAEADASRGVVYHARCAVVIAAKAAGVAAIDCVHLAVKDEAAFREDAALGLRLGFDGKLCIHPRQVEIANAVYTPRPEQIDYAGRVIDAWERAQAEGRGVFTLDGRMIDAPLVAVQRRVLERARRAGVLPGAGAPS
jgi:citrate lyase subunit beta/citryl-CoA lyase